MTPRAFRTLLEFPWVATASMEFDLAAERGTPDSVEQKLRDIFDGRPITDHRGNTVHLTNAAAKEEFKRGLMDAPGVLVYCQKHGIDLASIAG